MADILEQIAEHNEMIYLSRKLEVSLSEMKDMAYAAPSKGFAFENKLKEEGIVLDLSNAVMIHGGGWKKLISEAVEPD